MSIVNMNRTISYFLKYYTFITGKMIKKKRKTIKYEMYLGIDLGTSSVKILLIDEQQRIITSASSPLESSRPKPGWSEQDPEIWIKATELAMEEIKRENPFALSSLKGIGLSGQMHGAILLNAHNKPLRPCILWNDTRSHEEATQMNSNPKFQECTGNLVFPGFTAPKLAWLAKNEPQVFEAISKILLPKDYLRFWLTNEYISEMSDSSGTSWLDVKNRCWSAELLAKTASGLYVDQMPKLVEGIEPAGILRPELILKWGIPVGKKVIIAGGAGDNAASACGVGIVGIAFLSIGTSGVLFTAINDYRPCPSNGIHTFCHAIPGIWHQMGVSLSATDSLNWLTKITGIGANELIAELGEELRPPSEVTFLPYLSGERTPHNDAKIRGAFIGLSHGTDRTILTQAVLEGVAFSFRDIMEAMKQTGTKFYQIIAIGGGSRSIYWLKTIATALGMSIDLPKDGCDLGAAFGAARIGIMAAGEGKKLSEVCKTPEISTTFEPEEKFMKDYERKYKIFRQLYPSIKAITQ